MAVFISGSFQVNKSAGNLVVQGFPHDLFSDEDIPYGNAHV